MSADSLKEIAQRLDDEILKLNRKKKSFEKWAEEKRANYQTQKKIQLMKGAIPVEELLEIIQILENFDISTEEEKTYVINTFKWLGEKMQL